MAVVTIDSELCDNNHCCEAVCPTGVFVIVEGRSVVKNPSVCSTCLKCMESCPEGAVEVDF